MQKSFFPRFRYVFDSLFVALINENWHEREKLEVHKTKTLESMYYKKAHKSKIYIKLAFFSYHK